MTIEGMPAAEATIEPSLVRALLREQHADLAELTLTDAGEGWDNRLYRLGSDLTVRLPRREASAALIEHEQRWLPDLAPRLPLPVPVPVRIGRPGCGFPWAWHVAPWLPGTPAAFTRVNDAAAVAVQLGTFVSALHQPAPNDAPRNPVRRMLSDRSDAVYERARRLDGRIDAGAALVLWNELLRTPAWSGPPLWLHGDLHPGNLLVAGDALSAVVDFGDLTAGDPAVDLSVAWMLLPVPARSIFRAHAADPRRPVDAATWRRARGWALSLGLAYLAHSRDNELMATLGRRTIDAVLGDTGADS